MDSVLPAHIFAWNVCLPALTVSGSLKPRSQGDDLVVSTCATQWLLHAVQALSANCAIPAGCSSPERHDTEDPYVRERERERCPQLQCFAIEHKLNHQSPKTFSGSLTFQSKFEVPSACGLPGASMTHKQRPEVLHNKK